MKFLTDRDLGDETDVRVMPADYIEAAVIACCDAYWDDGFPTEPKAWALDYAAIEKAAREIAERRDR